MANYQAAHGKLPAVVYGKDGQPLHSWRVLILPYVEEEELYKEFHLDEPWDSPHNLALLPRMPKVYETYPGTEIVNPPHTTFYQVFTGPDTLFDASTGRRLSRDVVGKESATVL